MCYRVVLIAFRFFCSLDDNDDDDDKNGRQGVQAHFIGLLYSIAPVDWSKVSWKQKLVIVPRQGQRTVRRYGLPVHWRIIMWTTNHQAINRVIISSWSLSLPLHPLPLCDWLWIWKEWNLNKKDEYVEWRKFRKFVKVEFLPDTIRRSRHEIPHYVHPWGVIV